MNAKDRLQLILQSVEDLFGIIPAEIMGDEEEISKGIYILYSKVFQEGYGLGLSEGKVGARAIDSYGRAATPGEKLNMTQHRDVNKLVQLEKWSDPIKKNRRTRNDLVKVKAKARPK